jgi:DNA-binding NtrC family response regulator
MTVSESSSVSEVGHPAPLLGRDEELARLYRLVDELADHGGALVLRGEAGIGKTAMLAVAS